MGLFVFGMSVLAGPFYSGIDLAPFRSEKDGHGLFPVDGVPFVSYLKNQCCALLLELSLGPHWKQFYKANAIPLSSE